MALDSAYTASQITSGAKVLAIRRDISVVATVRSENEFIHCFVVSSRREPTVTQSLGVSVQLCLAFSYTDNQKMCMTCPIRLCSRDYGTIP